MQSTSYLNLADLVADPTKIKVATTEAIPELRAQLAKLDLLLESQFVLQILQRGNDQSARDNADKLLTADEATVLLGVTARWLYRHWKNLPFSRRLSRKVLRFSEDGIRRYMAAKRA